VSDAGTGIGVSALVGCGDEAAVVPPWLAGLGEDGLRACEGVAAAAVAVAGTAHAAAHRMSVTERRTRRG